MSRIGLLARDTGSAMVIALMTLVLLTMVGTYFLAQTKTETQIAGHDQRAAQALYNAEAGYGEILARLADESDSANYIGEPAGTVTPGWGAYVVLSANNSDDDPDKLLTLTDGLDNDGDGNVDETGEAYPEILSAQSGSGSEINYPWARVSYMLNATGQVILFGDHDNDLLTPNQFNLVRGYPVIVVRSTGGQGTANRQVEVEAIKQPFQIVQTACYAESDDFKFNGTSFLVSGQDWDPVTGTPIAGNPEVDGLVTTGDPGEIAGSLTGGQENNVEGTGTEPSIGQSFVDVDLQAMRDQFASLAEIVVPGGNYSNASWGGYDDYTVVHSTGDLHNSGGLTGGGVLIVDGDFSCTGGFTWYGLVIVMGDVSFSGGGQKVHIYGSTLVQGSGSGQIVGGNADLLYSSVALSKLQSLSPYTVYNWREVN